MENQVQEEQIMDNPYGSDRPLPSEAATLLEQTNPAALLTIFEHTLRGEWFDPVKEEFVMMAAGKPYLNDEGVSQVMFMLRGVVNSNCILSNLTDAEIKNIVIDFSDDIVDCLVLNYKKFAMDKRNISTIVGMCRRMCYFSLKRAYLGGEKEFLKKTSKEVISTTHHATQQRDRSVNNFWSLFKKN